MIFSDPGLIKYLGAGIENYATVAGIVAALAVMGYGEVMKRQIKQKK
jgi:hypothetical protein